MLLLQSKERFDDLVELEPVSGRLAWQSRNQNPSVASRSICGTFARVEGHIGFLYRSAGMLHLRIDDVDVTLDNSTEVLLIRDELNVLKVIRDRTTLLELQYKRPSIELPLALDSTPFVEEEDFDFGLFISNVMQNPQRRKDIYSGC